MSKSIGDKLAASLRQAKGGAAGHTSHQETGRNTVPNNKMAASKTRKPAATKITRQSDRYPPPNSDSPWENLHPEHIWPD